ncbi:hypothetical protein [Actinokineospora sp. NPDC004072]
MSLPIWLGCAVVVGVVVPWRLRIAAVRLRAILAEARGPAEAGGAAMVHSAAEPDDVPAIAWPHPPGRLWVR